MPARPTTRRRAGAFLALAALAALAVVALAVAELGSRGSGPERPRADLGAQTDAGALSQAVATALQDDAEGGGVPSPDTSCAAETRATYGRGLGPLVYTARLRWQGRPAVLLAYRLEAAPAGPLDHRAFVVAERGCELLVVQSL